MDERGLDSEEIERAAAAMPRANPPHLGVFASNELTVNLRKGCDDTGFSLIVNTDPSFRGGTHWVAMLQPPNRPTKLLFIEPFALPLHVLHRSLRQWIKENSYVHIDTVPFQIQPILTHTCGVFCLYILNRLPLYNFNLETLIRCEFDESDTSQNQAHVLSWWYKSRNATQ